MSSAHAGDGTCHHCQQGNTHICAHGRWPGFGKYGGYAEFLPVVALARQGRIRHAVEVVAFDAINDTLERLRAGDVVGRAVVKF